MKQSDKLYVRESKNGRGVFTSQLIKKDKTLLSFSGDILPSKDLPSPYQMVEDYYVQIGEQLYMGPSGGIDDFVNHSCDPNAGLVIKESNVVLVAIKDVRDGEEITWDYSTTMDEDDWELMCHCGSVSCRRVIRDFKHLPKTVQLMYAALGIVPDYNLKYV